MAGSAASPRDGNGCISKDASVATASRRATASHAACGCPQEELLAAVKDHGVDEKEIEEDGMDMQHKKRKLIEVDGSSELM